MARRRIEGPLHSIIVLAIAFLFGCSTPTEPRRPEPQDPETELTYAPVEGDTTLYRVHLYWNGYDKDGEITEFRFALDGDTANAFSKWTPTTAKDTTMIFRVDPIREVGGHVFWIRAVDNEGRYDRTPAKRFFSSKTVPPVSRITRGPNAPGTQIGPNFTFEWEGIDPDGSETGGPAPVDSFEYLLLQEGAQLDPNHPPLELPQTREGWVKLIVNAVGPSLPPPNDDWKWIGIRGKRKRFTNVSPGDFVFALRAVDVAGATEKLTLAATPSIIGISWSVPVLPRSDPRNLRDFNVMNRNGGPSLTVCSSVLVNCLAPSFGPEDIVRKEIQMFQGETVTFSWSATAASYGGDIVGYSSALDDTTTAAWESIDPANTEVTYTSLPLGVHYLFVRAMDDGGLITNVKVPLRIVHPAFKDAPIGRPKVLYVDDSAPPPGDWDTAKRGSPNYPRDYVPWNGDAANSAGSQEDNWWFQNILVKLGQEFGVDVTLDDDHDTVFRGINSVDGRYVFTPEELAAYRAIIWNVDLNNTGSSPTALWKTLVGGSYSALAGYLRAGGTLILTGFMVASQTSRFPDAVATLSFSEGMCATLDRSGDSWKGAYFAREFMGIDRALPSDFANRTEGAKDFVEARATAEGSMLGFINAPLDVGGSAAKWDSMAFNPTVIPDTRESRLAPGLLKIEGWKLARDFGCFDLSVGMRRENTGPVAIPILTYHGVPKGVRYDSGPSPREGMVVGIATQAHDLGRSGQSGPITTQNSKGVIGRMVFLGFPIYYIKDAEAYSVMRAAFAWVNASPTLPTYAP